MPEGGVVFEMKVKKIALDIVYFGVPLAGVYVFVEVLEVSRIFTYCAGLVLGVIAGIVLSHV